MHNNLASTMLPQLSLAASKGDKSTLKKILVYLPSRMLEHKDNFGRTVLILSVLNNHADCVSLLLKAGAQVDSDDNAGQTALHIAVQKGYSKCTKLLVSYNASWRHRDFDGITPLHLAAVNPKLKCLSILLKKIKPGEVDYQDATKKAALHWSAGHVCIEQTKMLLAKDAHICIPDQDGKTPLHWAVTSGKLEALEIVKILLRKARCLINWQDYEGRSALHLAVLNPNIEILYYLACREDCNVDILDNAFCTPLHWACRRGLWEKVNILLNHNAIPTSADGSGATPLHYAAYADRAKTVETFLSRVFIEDVGDAQGRNSFMWAAARNADKVLNYMAAKGADLAYLDKNGATTLHIATILNNDPAVTLLLKVGTPVDILDRYNMTPLLRACERGRARAGQVLLKFGADIHAADSCGRSTLHWCALGGHANLCQILVLQGANKNTKDCYGRVPLHYVSKSNDSINCACVLLESGADPNIIDNEGKTPLHYAVMNNRDGIVRMICEHDGEVNTMAWIHDWVTPLDLAIARNDHKIISALKEYNGLEACDIKEHAAMIIQVWYKKWRRLKNPRSLNSSTVLKKCNPIAVSTTSTTFPFEKFSMLFKRKYYVNNCRRFCQSCSADMWGDHQHEVKTEACLIIQKAWKNYSMRKKFEKMRNKINIVFKVENERAAAEVLWQKKLAAFYEELNS